MFNLNYLFHYPRKTPEGERIIKYLLLLLLLFLLHVVLYAMNLEILYEFRFCMNFLRDYVAQGERYSSRL